MFATRDILHDTFNHATNFHVSWQVVLLMSVLHNCNTWLPIYICCWFLCLACLCHLALWMFSSFVLLIISSMASAFASAILLWFHGSFATKYMSLEDFWYFGRTYEVATRRLGASRTLCVWHVIHVCISVSQPHVHVIVLLTYMVRLMFDWLGSVRHHLVSSAPSFIDIVHDSDTLLINFEPILVVADITFHCTSITMIVSGYYLLQTHFLRVRSTFPYMCLFLVLPTHLHPPRVHGVSTFAFSFYMLSVQSIHIRVCFT